MERLSFGTWLLVEEQRAVDPAVLQTYERAMFQALQSLILRVRDPALRSTLEGMKQCPVHDSQGRCHSFTGYILGALIRHGCHKRIDVDEALQRICFHMLSSTGEHGQPRKSLFDFDESRPYDLRLGNPVEVLFKTYLRNDLHSLCSGKLAYVRVVQNPNTSSPVEDIPARELGYEGEMLGDIVDLLKKRSSPDTPLVPLFQSIIDGDGTREQRRRFGRRTDAMREVIKDTIRQYAVQTQNTYLLRMLDKFKDFAGNRSDPSRRPKPKPMPKPKPDLPPEERDFRSIAEVIHKAGGSASMALLGKKRRRWLERKPRNPQSLYKSRLHDVLASMVQRGVLEKHASRYVPGVNFLQYAQPTEARGGVS